MPCGPGPPPCLSNGCSTPSLGISYTLEITKKHKRNKMSTFFFFKAYLCAGLRLHKSICNSSQRVYFPTRGALCHLSMSELGPDNLLSQMSKILCIKCQLTSRIWGPNTGIAAAQTRRHQHLLPGAPCPRGGCHAWTASKASCTLHPAAAKLRALARSQSWPRG